MDLVEVARHLAFQRIPSFLGVPDPVFICVYTFLLDADKMGSSFLM